MIKEIMSKKLVTVSPEDTISDAINLMDKHRYKELPVVDSKNKVLGLVTYPNILSIVKFNGNSKISNFIEGVPIINEEDSKEYTLKLMIDSGLMGLPVVDEKDIIKGFISDYDFIEHYIENLKNHPLTDANIKSVPAISELATLAEAKNIMSFNKRDRLPVIDGNGKFMGSVLFIDILRRMYKSDSSTNIKKDIISQKSNVLNNPIKDLVRKGVKVDFDSDLYDAAKIMLESQLLGLIIVNSENEPLGAIDRCSILKILKDISLDREIQIEIVGQANPKISSEIKRMIKSQLKLLPSYESSIKGIKVFIKRVHDDQNESKVDVRLTIRIEGKNDLIIQKTDFDILMTLMDCIDKANTFLKNKVRK